MNKIKLSLPKSTVQRYLVKPMAVKNLASLYLPSSEAYDITATRNKQSSPKAISKADRRK